MRWGGLEYLKVPQWRTAFETADVIFGVDVVSGREILVFGRGAQQTIAVTGMEDRLRVLRVSIDGAGDELELLIAACEAYRGHHDYEAESYRRDLRQRDLLARALLRPPHRPLRPAARHLGIRRPASSRASRGRRASRRGGRRRRLGGFFGPGRSSHFSALMKSPIAARSRGANVPSTATTMLPASMVWTPEN